MKLLIQIPSAPQSTLCMKKSQIISSPKRIFHKVTLFYSLFSGFLEFDLLLRRLFDKSLYHIVEIVKRFLL